MPVIWTLKKWLAVERDIYRSVELQALLAEKAGVRLSLQAVSALIKGTSNALRLQTIQALCNALECELHDFCRVLPDSAVEQERGRAIGGEPRRLYGAPPTPASRESIFPDLREYRDPPPRRDDEP
jgi:DNA-binding Xre family transcriptional regulator